MTRFDGGEDDALDEIRNQEPIFFASHDSPEGRGWHVVAAISTGQRHQIP